MAGFMKTYDDQTYALMRIVFGLMFVLHGSSKLLGFPVPPPAEAPVFIIWVAGGIELVGGAMIAAGFMTRWAAFVCSGLMAAAYWMAHGLNGLFPIQNHGEVAVLYCFAFLYISAKGAGIWSIDGKD
jgi:putative oxidoreductase